MSGDVTAQKLALFDDISTEKNVGRTKITVVGIGQVGMAAAYSIILQNVASDIALVDVQEDRLRGEMMDLQHGQAFTKAVKIQAGTDYALSAGSSIVVVTAGVRQKEGETRLSLVQRNVAIFKHIIPNVVKHSPNCIIVVVSNPVDILAHVAWKLSGFPVNRVIGSGTMLDSSRFRVLLGEKLGISASSCHGYIIGEHGDSSVAVWSGVNIAGTRLREVAPQAGGENDPSNWEDLHKQVINSAYEVIKLKGYTNWAIGTMVSTLCHSILSNQHNIYPLSTMAKGQHGVEEEVFLSLPCVVTTNGVCRIFKQRLEAKEAQQLQKSAKALAEVIEGIQW